MSSSYILSDNGVSSGSAGLKSTAGNDGVLVLQTANSSGTATNAVYVDNTQDVGIGTNAPVANTRLHVHDAVNTASRIRLTNATTTDASGKGLGIFQNGVDTYFTNNEAGAQVFSTSATERMRIDSSGNLLVGTTTQYGKQTIEVGGSYFTTQEDQGAFTLQATTAGRPLIMVRNTSDGNDCGFRVSAKNGATQYRWTWGINLIRSSGELSWTQSTTNTGVGTERMYLTTSGALYTSTGVLGSISDARFKENIVDASPKLNDLMQVQVRNFNMIGDELKQIGVVAQELETVFPNMVETSTLKDGTEQKVVKYSVFVPMLIKAIQEQQALITTLTERITALEAK